MSSPRIRASLSGIPTYKPGRKPAAAGDRPTYKLSSNETPFPPLLELTEAIQRAASGVNRYPDTTSARLAERLSDRFAVPMTDVAVGTGSVSLIYHLVQAICEPGDEVIYAWRSFEAYPIATQVGSATSVQVPLTSDARHDLDAMAGAVTERTRMILVCTPNNPTGPVVSQRELVALADRVGEDVLIVVDEAYLQFVVPNEQDPVADGLALYRERPNICVLRTFSKAYGLANLRVGFAIAAEPVAQALRTCVLPFPVSTVAEEAAIAALDLEDKLFARVAEVITERQRVRSALLDLGWPIPESEANFVWFPLDDRADEFAAACEEQGVVVRPFGGPGPTVGGCRVTIGEPEANDIVIRVAAQFPPPPQPHPAGNPGPQ